MNNLDTSKSRGLFDWYSVTQNAPFEDCITALKLAYSPEEYDVLIWQWRARNLTLPLENSLVDIRNLVAEKYQQDTDVLIQVARIFLISDE